jgi:hypothetical protein
VDQKIFICYSRADGEFAVRLDNDLDSAGFDSFLDQNDIPPGARWDEFVEKALKESTTVVVILSPASVSSQNVLDEIGYALREGKRVIPVLRQACQVPMRIDRLHYIDFTPSYGTGFGQLTSALKADAATRTKRKRARPEPPPPEPDPPPEPAVAAVAVVSRAPDLPLQPIVEVTPRTSSKLLPAMFAVLLLMGAGALWVWRSVSNGAVPVISTASTATGVSSPIEPTDTIHTTTAAPKTTTVLDTVTTTRRPTRLATSATDQPTTSTATTTTSARSSHTPTATVRAFECSEENLPGCCRDSTNLAQCRKCKKELDIPDRCE